MWHQTINPVFDYLLIIEPEVSVKKQIRRFQQFFTKNTQFRNAVTSQPHLTLMKALQTEMNELRIVNKLRRLAENIQPFDVRLSGFGVFQNTIYVDVQTVEPILDIVSKKKNEVLAVMNRNMPQAPYFASKPHVTIARGLTQAQRRTVWPTWREANFEEQFTAKRMTLLKRRAGHLEKYQLVEHFAFKGMNDIPSPATQLQLFN